jgi:hypothetical protein
MSLPAAHRRSSLLRRISSELCRRGPRARRRTPLRLWRRSRCSEVSSFSGPWLRHMPARRRLWLQLPQADCPLCCLPRASLRPPGLPYGAAAPRGACHAPAPLGPRTCVHAPNTPPPKRALCPRLFPDLNRCTSWFNATPHTAKHAATHCSPCPGCRRGPHNQCLICAEPASQHRRSSPWPRPAPSQQPALGSRGGLQRARLCPPAGPQQSLATAPLLLLRELHFIALCPERHLY